MTLPVEPTSPMTSPAHRVALAHAERALVAVPDLGAVIEGHDGLVAVGPVVAGRGDDAVGDGHDRLALVAVEVETGVVARPEAVVAELGGDREGLTGSTHWLSAIFSTAPRRAGRTAPERRCAAGSSPRPRRPGRRRQRQQARRGGSHARRGAAVEEVAAGLPAVAAQGVGGGEPGVGGAVNSGSATVTAPPAETDSAARPSRTGTEGRPRKSGPREPVCLGWPCDGRGPTGRGGRGRCADGPRRRWPRRSARWWPMSGGSSGRGWRDNEETVTEWSRPLEIPVTPPCGEA